MRILVIEDDHTVAKLVRAVLEEEGYAVDIAHSGEEGRTLALVNRYDGIILDIELPDRNGLTVLTELRREGATTPVLIMSGRAENPLIVRALDAGADDYVVKPVANELLSARVRALVRRSGAAQSPQLTVADVVVNRLTREVLRNGVPLTFTPKEFSMLEYLMLHVGEPVTRTRLREAVWDMTFDPESNVVDANVNRLRRKLERANTAVRIESVRGVGYRIRAISRPVPPELPT